MRLNAIGDLQFDVRARTDRDAACLRLRIGPLHFTMTEAEALRLANRIADAIEQHRRSRERADTR